MTDFDFASGALAAVLAADAFIAFRWAMTILSVILSFWWAMPLFIRQRIESKREHERERTLRRLGAGRDHR